MSHAPFSPCMKIGIVGLGLIGGSLGLDFRALGHQVLGVSRKPQTCELALQRGAVDQASDDLSLLSTADVVFICTPLGSMRNVVERLIPYLYTDAIVTDVGSVKASVVDALHPLWPRFLGGHPMSGTEAAGIEAAQSNLFQGNSYVLTPVDETPAEIIPIVEPLVQSLGGTVYKCAPAEHDRAVAWISHLPAIASTTLIAACLQETDSDVFKLAQDLASSGFRDTSRVGGGNPELTRMMAEHNPDALLQSLRAYRQTLDQLTQLIEQGDWDTLEAQCIQTQKIRPQFM
ncbi:Prephenate dehydrogenase [Acaryochloris thomasi RCC1774]|uniref:Prephenate dehydrogenase n=2 Tax=Acaryochloris TaxID=155977 RepID=A0A2W1K6H1_9CYAN|nr:Prephenate dehydrogenase [Acaryochloris thomasi RCC1774]